MFSRYLFLLPVMALAACSVDTTGLSGALQNTAHPRSTANAGVIVTEYSDLQCPACRTAHALVTQPLLDAYGSQIRFEFRHMPLTSIHQFALPAAEAAECAADQGKFWEFIDLAYEEQERLSVPALEEWGVSLGLDQELYQRCRTSRIKRDAIEASFDAARALNIGGTPTYFVNGVQVPTTLEALGTAIKKAATGMRERL